MSVLVDVYCPARKIPDNVYVLGADLATVIPEDGERASISAEIDEMGFAVIGGGSSPTFLLLRAEAPAASLTMARG